ncbi:response regulator transcription factor [Streptomyces marincola]|uniref:DNA-binding response regulator n=1 Tax=Streptomyces marincola TaxID=2878388 RepID=A0A1W7D219_9ACTN|nr:response regulator transcription factor [Streptomyces marincola]ARQ71066.1 DNA-binding response regulator [Streptomyces marincola]
MRVLVVGGGAESVAPLIRRLRAHGYDTVHVDTGARALAAYRGTDLVLLDLQLPDIGGLEVCRGIRSTDDVPVIAFAAPDAEHTRVLALRAGADDCMDKPYRLPELMARIDAVMRRSRPCPKDEFPTVSYGPLRIDVISREVRLHGRPIALTRKEFDLLYRLALHRGEVVSRQRLMAEIWGDPLNHPAGRQATRTIDTHVSKLRGKLGVNSWIETVRGVGFRLGHD